MSLVTFMQDNVQADTHISFAYNGGSNPGTRRTVRFIEPHQLLAAALRHLRVEPCG